MEYNNGRKEKNSMIRPLCKDPMFLSLPASSCTEEDSWLIKDLNDTLNQYHDTCLGMAANMIGFCKDMIILNLGITNLILINPRIVKKSEPYRTAEGCLCLSGQRQTQRYRKITVEYLDASFRKCRKDFSDLPAEVIQHEMDHCRGILI